MLGVQALVAFLLILVGALLFVNDIGTERIIVSITLVLSLIVSFFLVRSVKKEVEQKEALEVANKEISDKKEHLEIANKEIAERNDQLGKMADYLDKVNGQLKIANSKLKVLDEAKSAFFARASHDLRNPVTSVNGFLFLVLKGACGTITGKTKDVLQKSYNTTKIMLDLIEDFLTAAQLETGDMKYSFAKCDLTDICQQVIEMLESKAETGKIYLDFKKPQENLPELVIDGGRIRESITNLIDNAIKYTEKGGVTVMLERAESSNHKLVITNDPDENITPEIVGPVVRVTVSDTGMGIPEDGIQHLFAKFSRGNSNASRKKSGHGLGLYFCKMMIEDNGGKVWAESDGEGKGSRFIVEFPINSPENILNQIVERQEHK